MNKILQYTQILILIFQVSPLSANYHVSKIGADTNSGTLLSPFLTISNGSTLAVAGDTVFIHEGTYEETLKPSNSGTSIRPIVFQGYKNEKVIISAMQALSGWTLDAGSVYKVVTTWDLNQQNFVVNGSTACDLARWPNNTDGNPFTLNSNRNTAGSASTVITDAWLTDPTIPDFDWSKGGSVFFYGDKPGGGWTAWKAFITSSTTGKVSFNLNKNPDWIRTAHAPADKGDYFLEGIKEALDYQNEWYFDSATKTLYIQLPGGIAPIDNEVKMRRRNLCVDLNSRNYIEIKNLAVFGGSIEISGNYNKIKGVSSFYGNMNRGVVTGFSINSHAIYVKYNALYNEIEQCELGFSSGSGIWDAGNYTTIKNNYIHDFNFVGCYDAAMMARGGTGTMISNNTIKRGGRDCIQITSKNSIVSYNDVSESNMIADDCGLLYTIGKGLYMKIHHNWFHDTKGRGTLVKAAGVYLDNDAAEVDLFCNVIWNIATWPAIQINWNGTNINVFNNTIWNCSSAMGAWHNTGTAFSNVNVWNNLTNLNSLEAQSDKQNNLIMGTSDNPFTNYPIDFTLKNATVKAVDYGKVIAGINDGYVGLKPDAGAYEFGGEKWKAGVSWNLSTGPNANGCYGLPGEMCMSDADGDGVSDDLDNCPNTPFGTVVDLNGCPANTSVAEILSNKVKLYPNPLCGSTLFFELVNINSDIYTVEIYAINGQKMKVDMISVNSLNSIDCTNIPAGIYTVKFANARKVTTTKILKY